jgi:hypothetical protein
VKRCDKIALDTRVAEAINFRRKTVAVITREFLEQVAEALANGEEVQLTALGKLKVFVQEGKREATLAYGLFKPGVSRGKRTVSINRRLKVSFSKNSSLTKRLKERFDGEARSR